MEPQIQQLVQTHVLDKIGNDAVIGVYLSGSRADRLSHRFSDYDIYVVTAADLKLASQSYALCEDFRVQIEWITQSEIQKIIDVVNARGTDFQAVPKRTHEVAWRLHIGIPLHDTAALQVLKQSLRFQNLQIVVMEELRTQLHNSLEDFFGFCSDELTLPAFYFSKELASMALDLLLASKGELTDRSKFRMQKSLRTLGPESDFLARYTELMNAAETRDLTAPYYTELFRFISDVESAYVRFYLQNERTIH